MAKRVVKFDRFVDYDEEEEKAARIQGLPASSDDDSKSIAVEEAADSLKSMITEAVDFIQSDWMPKWEHAQKYYNGESDLPIYLGRSKATDTPVRDAIRAAKTSILRQFCQAEQIVRYTTENPEFDKLVQHQTHYVNKLYWANDGFLVLESAIQDALLKNVGITETYVVEKDNTEFYQATYVTAEDIQNAQQDESITILSVEPTGSSGQLPLFNCHYSVTTYANEVRHKHVPLYSFFVSDSANNEHDARVIGYRESVFVADAIEMGLEADWEMFDDEDIETSQAAGESDLRRGYNKNQLEDMYDVDPTMKRFLLTKCYARFDLEGLGVPQLYCFWLGGTDYTYIAHDRVAPKTGMHRYLIDPEPSSFFGKSFFDILKENQDVQTSLLRAVVDNAHLANNNRLAVHETLVNMSDVLSPKVGQPIRVRSAGQIQQIGVQPMAAQLLPLIQDIRQQSEVKSGITRAAQGLEPDALQSTDKEAVRNTIIQAAGMIEYCARNLAETGVKSTCVALLQLSMQHYDRNQHVKIDGNTEMADLSFFRPGMEITTNVGLGTASFDLKIGMLSEIIQMQLMQIEKLGLDNPMVTYDNVTRAIADKAKLMGIDDTSRYFNKVPPEVITQFQAKLEEKMAGQAPPDPSAGLVEAEKIKSQTKLVEMEQKHELDVSTLQVEFRQRMIELQIEDDFRRDELIQKLKIEIAKINKELLHEEAVLEQQYQTTAASLGQKEKSDAAKLKQIDLRAQKQNSSSGNRPKASS